MKRTLINLLSLAVIIGGGTQLNASVAEFSEVDEVAEPAGETNYQTCMAQCERSGYLFFTCHNACKGLAEAN